MRSDVIRYWIAIKCSELRRLKRLEKKKNWFTISGKRHRSMYFSLFRITLKLRRFFGDTHFLANHQVTIDLHTTPDNHSTIYRNHVIAASARYPWLITNLMKCVRVSQSLPHTLNWLWPIHFICYTYAWTASALGSLLTISLAFGCS